MDLNSYLTHFMPYLLRPREAEGVYAVLNRDYQSIGAPVYPAFVRATMRDLRFLRAEHGDVLPGQDVYLYNDGCHPDNGGKDASAYLAKLVCLWKLPAVTVDGKDRV